MIIYTNSNNNLTIKLGIEPLSTKTDGSILNKANDDNSGSLLIIIINKILNELCAFQKILTALATATVPTTAATKRKQ